MEGIVEGPASSILPVPVFADSPGRVGLVTGSASCGVNADPLDTLESQGAPRGAAPSSLWNAATPKGQQAAQVSGSDREVP